LTKSIRSDRVIKDPKEAVKSVFDCYAYSANHFVEKMKPKWEFFYKLYRSFVEVDDDEVISNFFLPLIFSHVESFLARLVANRPRVEAWGREPSDNPKAKIARDLLAFYWDALGLAMKFMLATKSAEIFGLVWAKVNYHKEVKPRLVRRVVRGTNIPLLGQVDLSQFIPGMQQGQISFKEDIEDILVWDDPKVEILDPAEVFPDPNGSEIENFEWVIHRYTSTWEEIDNATNPDGKSLYKPKAKAALKEWFDKGGSSKDSGRVSEVSYTMKETFGEEDAHSVPSPTGGVCHILEKWSDTVITVVVEELGEDQTPLMNEINRYGALPFVKATPIPLPKEITGISIPEILFSLNLEINTLHNTRMDSALTTVHRMYKILRGSNINPAELVFRTPGYIHVDDMDDIQPFESQALPFTTYRESEFLRMFAQLATGANDNFAGGVQQGGGGTATEASLLAQAAGSRAGLMFQVMSEQFLKPLGKLLIRAKEAYISRDENIRVISSNFVVSDPIIVRPEDLLSGSGMDLNIIFDVASTEPVTSEIKAQKGIQALQALQGVLSNEGLAQRYGPVLLQVVDQLVEGLGYDLPDQQQQQLAIPGGENVPPTGP
jgi:hypothetical protein